MKPKRVCLFCMRSHKKIPLKCKAKGAIMDIYLKAGYTMSQLLAAVHTNELDLEAQALKLVHKI